MFCALGFALKSKELTDNSNDYFFHLGHQFCQSPDPGLSNRMLTPSHFTKLLSFSKNTDGKVKVIRNLPALAL